MLTIGPETFAAARREEEESYIGRLIAVLRETVPDLAAEPPAQMDAQVRLQIEAARSHGLQSEQAVAAYVMTAAQLGPDFVDQFPAIQQILLDDATDAKKADNLERFTVALFEDLER